MENPVVLSSYNLSTLSESIRYYLIGSDHPVLRRAMGYFFKGDMDSGKKVRSMMVLIVSRVMLYAEAEEALEAEDQTEMMQKILGIWRQLPNPGSVPISPCTKDVWPRYKS